MCQYPFLFVGVLRPGNIYGHIRTGIALWQCALMAILCPTGRSGCHHYFPIPDTYKLSWHWTNQSLPYPNNAEHQVSSINFVHHWFESVVFKLSTFRTGSLRYYRSNHYAWAVTLPWVHTGHKSIPISDICGRIWPWMLLGRKTPITKRVVVLQAQRSFLPAYRI